MEDVDGNRLIDLSGIAKTTIGNSSPRVVDAVRTQVAEFTHTCFMVTPYEGYVVVAEHQLITPGSGPKRWRCSPGAEAKSRTPSRSHAPYTGGGGVRPRLPRSHQPNDGATAKSRPTRAASVRSWRSTERHCLTLRDGLPDKQPATIGELASRPEPSRHRQAGDNLAALVIEPIQGEGGFHRSAGGSYLPSIMVPQEPGCSSPTRCKPGFCSYRGDVRLRARGPRRSRSPT